MSLIALKSESMFRTNNLSPLESVMSLVLHGSL